MNKKEQKTNDKPRKKRKLTVKERVKQRRKKAIITAVVSATAIVLVSVALIVLNVFIPVKYLASYFVVGNRMKNGDLRVSFIDVGYGDCIIIELPDGKNMLIDAGDGRYATNSKVLKELNGRIIAARQNNMLVTSFHPELTDDETVHRYFLNMFE